MVLTSLAVFLDIVRKAALTLHVEHGINVLQYLVRDLYFDVDLFEA